MVKEDLQQAPRGPNFQVIFCAVHWMFPISAQSQMILRQDELQG